MSASRNPSDAENYLNLIGASNNGGMIRVSVPAYERMLQLYAFGHSNAQICEMLQQEFNDIDYNPMTPRTIRKVIEINQTEFQIARMNLGMKCRDEIQNQIATLFRATEDVECLMVSVYVNKLRDALNNLASLDMEEQDEDGNYKNTSRIFVLLEMAEKLQSKIAKIVGTDALREIEAYRQKMEAKATAEKAGGSLLPPQAKGTTLEAEEVKPKFI